MAAPRKFDAETRERAVRMYHEHLADVQCSKLAARRHVGSLLGVKPATLRNWVEAGAPASGQTAAESAKVKRLKREVAELRRASEILKTASAFFAAAELERRDRPHQLPDPDNDTPAYRR